eukprot:jgi/Undpi1/14256/HiC_scaffold_9.g03905.m1
MGDDLASAIAATQEQLGGLFQKPKLSDKLLSKAPFRFLHDIVSAVTASTGFAAGLYSGDELDSGAIKDKASKIAYLDKLVALVGLCSGHEINARPSKIVAGLEPEGTNALLTALGKCARSADLDFEEAARRVLAGDSPGSSPPPLRSDKSTANRKGGNDDNNDGGRGGEEAGRGGARASGSAGGAEEKGREGVHDGKGMRGGGGGSAGSGGSGEGRGESGGGRRGSAERGRGSEAKASAKQEIEERGEAAKALGAPQSRRLSSRAGGGSRAESKSDSFAAAGGGLGDDPGGVGGRDLALQIEACTGDISVTRAMLEPIISRPKLSDKLLNMPPFRFLHDIFSEVTRQTDFGKGLFSGDELDSSLVKAKPAKIAYLDKLIMLIGNSLNTLVDARPAKIVAGLEAENTNRMLQLLALATVERPDSSRAVAAVLASNAALVKRRSSSGSAGGGDRGGEGGGEALTAQGETDRPPQPSHRRVSSATSGVPVPAPDQGRARGASAGEEKRGGGARQEPAEEKAGSNAYSGDVARRDTGNDGAADGGGEAPRSMRPRTARRRPPAVKDNTKAFADSNRSQVAEQSAAAPKAANIMMDGDGDQEALAEGGGGGAKSEGGHTAMVADILKEKERAEVRAKEADAEAKGAGGGQAGQERKGTPEGGGIRMGRLRGAGRTSGSSLSEKPRGATGAGGGGGGYGDGDVAKLKEAIQTLCQSTHPLGKCMDFVHEDMSLMSQEMDRWRALQKVKAKALEAERASLESFLQPLNAQLRDLDDQLKESSMKIDGVKAAISSNDKKIHSLLKMVVTS